MPSQVGRTRSITLSQTLVPAAPANAASVPSPDGAKSAEGKDNSKQDDEGDVELAGRESLADKVRDAAATAAASLIHASSAAARGSALGGGSSMEGRWHAETFLLPVPDGDDTFIAAHAEGGGTSDVRDSLDKENDGAGVAGLSGPAALGSGDEDGDAARSNSDTASVDDGVHLRVEIWQGKHCHGQVDAGFAA